MGLFKKFEQVKHETSYQDVVDVLEAMSDQEYAKIIKVVNIYRKANKDVEKILPLEVMPPIIMDGEDFLFGKDTELGNFLDDDHESTASKKQRKTAAKAKK
jgi:hypothetical protein